MVTNPAGLSWREYNWKKWLTAKRHRLDALAQSFGLALDLVDRWFLACEAGVSIKPGA